MALIKTIHCTVCGLGSDEAVADSTKIPTVCGRCQSRMDAAVKEGEMRKLRKFSVPQRVARLESLLYDVGLMLAKLNKAQRESFHGR